MELEFSPDFWRMIEESRHSTVRIPLTEVMAGLNADEQRSREKEAVAPAKASVPEP